MRNRLVVVSSVIGLLLGWATSVLAATVDVPTTEVFRVQSIQKRDGHGFHARLRQRGPNDAFLGDYRGVAYLKFSARHTGIGDNVDLRVFLFDSTNNAVSNESAEILSTDTSWTSYTIDLRPDSMWLNPICFALICDEPTLEGLLQSVFDIGLRHDPERAGAQVRSPLTSHTEVEFRDVVLRGVPEPEFDRVFLLVGGALLACRRRCRQGGRVCERCQ